MKRLPYFLIGGCENGPLRGSLEQLPQGIFPSLNELLCNFTPNPPVDCDYQGDPIASKLAKNFHRGL
jgi:hypothetical protein